MFLQNSPKFQQEYQSFKQRIENISDQKTKLEAQRLLREMLEEVKRLDHSHQGLTFQQKLPDDIGIHRKKLAEIRKKLDKLL